MQVASTQKATSKRRIKLSYLTAILLLLGGYFGFLNKSFVYATGEDLTTPANKTGQTGEAIAITDLQITGDADGDVSIAVSATNGVLNFGSEDANITGGGTSAVAVSGPLEDVNSTLATLTFTSAQPGVSTITADYGSSVTDVIIDPIGGHAYKIIDDDLTWNQARAAAQQLVYGGVQGYLANITSESEDEFIVEHLTGNGWIGASDQDEEGKWIWMDGPEAGAQFWQGNNMANGGQPVLGPGDVPVYNNWNWSEPNNSGNEDCAEYIVGMGWNDLGCNIEYRSYVIEFGAGEVPEQIVRQFTITTTAATQNISTCEQLFNLTSDANRYDTINLSSSIDCTGVEDLEPLFDEGSFQGVFNGNGYTIRGVTIEQPYNSCVGLIRRAYNATVSNLSLVNFSISGEEGVGSFIGCAENTNIENVHARNIQVNSEYGYSGGLIGEYYGYTNGDGEDVETYHITQSSASGSLTAEYGSDVGGLVGYAAANDGTSFLMEQVYADVDISINSVENDDIGGLIGELELDVYSDDESIGTITVQDAYTWGDVNAPGNWNVGGLIGRADLDDDGEVEEAEFIVQRTYAQGDVEGYENVGGLIGHFDGLETEYDNAYLISNNFVMGKVTGGQDNFIGGLVGDSGNSEENTVQYTNNYIDQTRTTTEVCVGNGDGGECTPVNTDGSQPNYFINNITSPPLNTWNFEGIWVQNQGVPPTFNPVTDIDGDGIEDDVENSAPNNGDANNDGTPDSEQANVAALIDPVTGNYAVLVVDEECSITSVSIAAEGSAQKDVDYDYPAGLMDFTLDCGQAGFTANVSQYYYGVSGDFVVRKLNPETGIYSTISTASTANQTIAGNQVKVASYQVTDGGELDLDGAENGIIKDPAGLARPASANGNSSTNLAGTGSNTKALIAAAVLLIALGGFIIFGTKLKGKRE